MAVSTTGRARSEGEINNPISVQPKITLSAPVALAIMARTSALDASVTTP